MSHEHELSKYQRNGNRANLDTLLEMGKEYQSKVNWTPKQPEKNSGKPKEKVIKPKTTGDSVTPLTLDKSLNSDSTEKDSAE